MRLLPAFFLSVMLIFLTAPAEAEAIVENAPGRAYILPRSEVISLKSDINGVDYELYVRLPLDYEEGDKSYPLLVTLDADYQFAIAANHVEHLSGRGQAPEMIIVSISYAYDPDDGYGYRLNRSRDYTPWHRDDGGYGPEFQKASGGGPAFADFIRKEMLPYLEETYRIDTQERVFIGHSFGGLFGAYVLLSHPDIFNRYILVSPSLWYDDSRPLKEAAKKAKPLPRKTYVYMGVGDWENQGASGSHAMVDDLKAFAALLEAHRDPNLVTKIRVYEDETHASIYPAVLSTGLRHLFQTMDE